MLFIAFMFVFHFTYYILHIQLNMVVMGLVVKVFLTLRTNTQKTEVARFR